MEKEGIINMTAEFFATEWCKVDEGYKRFPYLDTVGIMTVGYGRNLITTGIREEEAAFMLGKDVEGAADELRRAFAWFGGLSVLRQAVLIDMVVNMGLGRLMGFKRMLEALKAGNWRQAAIEMLDSKWARQVHGRADKLAYVMRHDKVLVKK